MSREVFQAAGAGGGARGAILSALPSTRFARRLWPSGALAWGFTVTVLALLVLLPLAAIIVESRGAGLQGFTRSLTDPVCVAALRLSFGGALLSAAVNSVMGLVVAWALVRCSFRGRGFLDSAVDLPFALPTSVAGVTLAELFGPQGWIGGAGARLAETLGVPALASVKLQLSYTVGGVLIAMTFVSLPFVVRSVQPVLHALETDVEEAARLLGASPLRVFRHVVLPSLKPALLAGFALSFSRSLGEFGSVVIISGNMPMRTLTGPVLVFQKVEQYDPAGAASIAIVMLAASLVTLVAVAAIQSKAVRRG